MTTLLASLIVGIAKFPLLRWQAGASSSSQDSSRRVLPKASDIVMSFDVADEWQLFAARGMKVCKVSIVS